MRAVEVLRKKRDGGELSREEIGFLIRGFSSGAIPDYQISAFLMAVYFSGMTDNEAASLTEEMRDSGTVLDLSSIPGRKVDKHSTGGVGDKTSLIVAPAIAAAGLTVPMISGRGLAHTGGTLDKLESIPGFNVHLSLDRFKQLLSEVRAALIGQTDDLVPADRRLYALRDVTATVGSQPLIVSSIMSKKLAEGVDGLVLDVKCGSGAVMRRQEDAEKLARAMVRIGTACGKKVVALITDMSQPLGEYVGNALEVMESLEALKGRGPQDLVLLCEEIGAQCLIVGQLAADGDEAKAIFRETISSGRALEKFREIIRGQDGNPAVVDDYTLLPSASRQATLASPAAGFVAAMDTEKIGLAMCVLGAGREALDSTVDHSVGMRLHKKIGDPVGLGEPLCTLYYNDEGRHREAAKQVAEAYSFAEGAPMPPKMIRKLIS